MQFFFSWKFQSPQIPIAAVDHERRWSQYFCGSTYQLSAEEFNPLLIPRDKISHTHTPTHKHYTHITHIIISVTNSRLLIIKYYTIRPLRFPDNFAVRIGNIINIYRIYYVLYVCTRIMLFSYFLYILCVSVNTGCSSWF